MSFNAETPVRLSLSPESEQALRVSDAIISISADAIISIDEDQRILRFNQGAEQIFGYTANEVMGQPIDVLIPARFRPPHREQVRDFGKGAVAARRMGERRQIFGLRKGEVEFPAEASISKTSVGGQLIFTVVLRDVTDRLRAERGQRFLGQAGALLSSSLDTDLTLESLAKLAVPVLGDWCVIFLNADGKATQRALSVHVKPEHAADMRALREIPFAMRPRHPIMPALTAGQSVVLSEIDDRVLEDMADNAEHHEVLKRLRPKAMLAVPLKVGERILGALCFFRDQQTGGAYDDYELELAEELGRRAALAIENARLYAQAQDAIHARDDVLAVVSHDLGNPLAAIRISTTLLLKQLTAAPAAGDAHKQVENIRASVLQMERLINDLLDVKRIEGGYLTLEKRQTLVHALLRDAIDALSTVIDGKQLRLRELFPADGAEVVIDRERMLQVFSNLVGNAVKFTPAGGEITIGARTEPHAVVFWVADSGPGIPQEHLPHVFDRFWQARRTGRHGIGLGLAIVKGIIDAHGGKVWVESALGVGSTFYFTLARAE